MKRERKIENFFTEREQRMFILHHVLGCSVETKTCQLWEEAQEILILEFTNKYYEERIANGLDLEGETTGGDGDCS